MAEPATAFAFLLQHWRKDSKVAGLPPALVPATRTEAYRQQAEMEAQSAHPLSAWKLAATSIAGQKHIGVDGPLVGRYIAERVVASGTVIPFDNNGMRVAEVEFAFLLGKDIAPRSRPYDEAEVFSAISSLHPAIEIPDSRFKRFETAGGLALIADNACAHWLCIGAAAPESWREMDLAAFEPLGTVKGRQPIKGCGANVLGSPRIAMTWFVNEMTAFGVTLKAGQFCSTGTCLTPMAIAPQAHVTGDFGILGRVEVSLGS
jgi:2-keto-4-pentenoate hydratase